MNYRVEWLPVVVPWAGIVLLLAPPVAMLAVVVLALAAVGAVVALAGGVLALPFLLARSLHRHWHGRRSSTAHHSHAKIVGRDMSTPDEELSILHAAHPFASPSRPHVAADLPVRQEAG